MAGLAEAGLLQAPDDFLDRKEMEAAAPRFAFEPATIALHLEHVPQGPDWPGDAEATAERFPEDRPETRLRDVYREYQPAPGLQNALQLLEQAVVSPIGIAARDRILRFGIRDGQTRNNAVEGGIGELRQPRAEINRAKPYLSRRRQGHEPLLEFCQGLGIHRVAIGGYDLGDAAGALPPQERGQLSPAATEVEPALARPRLQPAAGVAQ